MTNQHDQIRKASRAYVMILSNSRFQIFLQNGDHAPAPVWPDILNFPLDQAMRRREFKKIALSYQIYSEREKWPAFHFYLKGTGYSKKSELKQMLLDINPEIKVYDIKNGHISNF